MCIFECTFKCEAGTTWMLTTLNSKKIINFKKYYGSGCLGYEGYQGYEVMRGMRFIRVIRIIGGYLGSCGSGWGSTARSTARSGSLRIASPRHPR